MENLILIQTIINNIEFATLDVKYHSTFDYKDDRHLIVKTFCWEQASIYKNIFDKMKDVVVYIQSNSLLEFVDISNYRKAEE